jgi:hypothetical protein
MNKEEVGIMVTLAFVIVWLMGVAVAILGLIGEAVGLPDAFEAALVAVLGGLFTYAVVED